MTVSYSQSVVFSCPADALLDQAAQILKEDWRVRKMVRDVRGIRAKTRINIRTLGDVIKVVIIQQQASSVTAEISSETAWKTTLVDYGKSKDNVERLCVQITERLNPSAG